MKPKFSRNINEIHLEIISKLFSRNIFLAQTLTSPTLPCVTKSKCLRDQSCSRPKTKHP